ncbi:hypothetical protein ATO11_07175 [Pseudaestuariivita atlantica]|uniref:Uncharacterized protein n=2 Tax=Pseudaestuariivita atlantica TaxID=1317121 RepID=A0A0L1JRM1_9RHOB|nr:hypothetical protein ATO11_07175 [Pseudaestuariivita atlantica]
MAVVLSVLVWIGLGLPPACAALAVSHAREGARVAGRRRMWLWLCLAVLFLSALVIGLDAAARAFAATGCSAGPVVSGCAGDVAARGETLLRIELRILRYLPPVALFTLLIGALALVRAWLARRDAA